MTALLDELESEVLVFETTGDEPTLRGGDVVQAHPGRHRIGLHGPDGRAATVRWSPASSWSPELLSSPGVLLRLEEPVSELAILRAWVFASGTRWHEPRTVAVDEEAAEVTRHVIGCEEVDALLGRLRSDVPISVQPPTFACYLLGDDPDIISFVTSDYVVDVRLVEGQLRIYSASRPRSRIDIGRLQLVTGPVEFVEASYGTALDSVAVAEHRATADAGRYFATWRSYTSAEAEAAQRRAADFPTVNYVDVEQDSMGDLVFRLVNGHPAARLLSRLRKEGSVVLEASGPNSDPVHGECRPLDTGDNETVVMRRSAGSTDRRPPGKGSLAYSTLGDDISIRRRADALASTATYTPRRAIELLLDGALPEAPERRVRHEPLSSAVLAVFDEVEPTDAQRRALDVALNTPDFAIIQGPPGTGKTRVIAALQARLDEIHHRDRPGNESRQVLLTGPQHDAVEHATTASTRGRLPAIKLGSKHGEPTPGSEQSLRWRRDIESRLESVETPGSSRKLLDAAAQFRARHERLAALTAPREALEMLRWLASDQASPFIRESTAAKLTQLVARYERSVARDLPAVEIPRIERAARALRGSPAGFADDGRANCRGFLDLLDALELGAGEDRDLLEMLSDGPQLPDEQDLARLRGLRDGWLDLCARSQATGGAAGPEVKAIFDGVARRVDELIADEVGPVTLALDTFARRLREEPVAVHNSLLRHTSTLAATLQQSASKPVTRHQPLDEPYETVIVDEAARALPADLLIPLSRARTRVVLVGDHRQLPQHVDEEIVEGARDVDEEHVRTSMFQRLFDALAGAAGPERRVTLDTQFRMHPTIGTVISETFYAPHGEALVNGVTAEERSVDALPVGNPLTWVDVPADAGPEMGRVRRPCEAEAVVEWLLRVLGASTGTTVGVIAPYVQQVEALWAALGEHDLAARDRFGSWAPSSTWGDAFDDGVRRFRVGTIDSFQGREFDVVLFSATRCSLPARPDRNLFGFLRSPNRMNVALSRARRALVVVGDRQLFAQKAAEDVPALHLLAERAPA